MVLHNLDTRMYEQNIKLRERLLRTYIWYPPAIWDSGVLFCIAAAQ